MSTTTADGPRLALSPVTVRLLLRVDAAACGLFGLLAVVAAGAVTGPLDAPTPLLVVGGLVLLVYAVEAAFVARRPTRGWLLALAGVNGAFAAGCVIAVVTASLSGAGVAIALGLAGVSVAMAEVLLLGARSAR